MIIIEDTMTLRSIDEFRAMLDGMLNAIRTPSVAPQSWQQVVDVLQDMERGFFASSAGPDGQPWAPLRPYTVQKKGHAIILRETWELMDSLTKVNESSIREFGQATLEFGTQRAWAWLHQDGGRKVPQRMMVGATDEAVDKVLDIIADAAVRMMFA
jgi:hypothetical protein